MLLSKTTRLAVQCLVYLARWAGPGLVNPRAVAAALDESPAYVSKVLRLLARGGLVRSRRGSSGGFQLLRPPRSVRLLDIVVLCQGPLTCNYCTPVAEKDGCRTCGLHQALGDLERSTQAALGRWTLERILRASDKKLTIEECYLRPLAVPSRGRRGTS